MPKVYGGDLELPSVAVPNWELFEAIERLFVEADDPDALSQIEFVADDDRGRIHEVTVGELRRALEDERRIPSRLRAALMIHHGGGSFDQATVNTSAVGISFGSVSSEREQFAVFIRARLERLFLDAHAEEERQRQAAAEAERAASQPVRVHLENAPEEQSRLSRFSDSVWSQAVGAIVAASVLGLIAYFVAR